jgi:hypothetical protein
MRKKLQAPFERVINRDQDAANQTYYLRDIAQTLRLLLEVADFLDHSIEDEDEQQNEA